MAKGENIFKRKDGRWEARYIKKRDDNGKIQYGYCYGKTYREAKEKVTTRKMSLLSAEKQLSSQEKRTLNFYSEQWLEIHQLTIKESTYIKYRGVLKKYINPHFGGFFLKDINDELIRDFTQELLVKYQLSSKTAKDILVVFRSVMSYAAKHEPDESKIVTITYPKVCKNEMRVLDPAEQKAFIHFLISSMDQCKFGVLLALLTGLRIGEICALQWRDISIFDGTISIRGSMQRLQRTNSDVNKTKIIINTPKSQSSIRTIPMTQQLNQLCQKMRADDAYILTGTRQFMEPRTLQYRFKNYTQQCGLDNVHFHTLRHTFATRCVESGFEIKSLSEILGHSTTAITLDRYVHSSLELKRKFMENTVSAFAI